MDCKICERPHRQFFCENCLKIHSKDFRVQLQHYVGERDEQIIKASRALEHIAMIRIPRAKAAECQRRVQDLTDGLGRLRKDNDRKRDRLRTLREQLASRRRSLSAAKLLTSSSRPSSSSSSSPTHTNAILSREAQELATLSNTIARARSGLVQELVEVFNVVEVGGRPPIGGKAGSKGEWTIGGLILPVPGDIRRYPPDHINAVITHTVHFLSLLTFYLGIKLPFEITWSGKKLGVGQPWIGAIRGGENGGWAKWYRKHPLHLSSSAPPTSTLPSSEPSHLITGASPITTSNSSTNKSNKSSPKSNTLQTMNEMNIDDNQIPLNTAITESYMASTLPDQPHSSFTTALAMLLYNVSYLAWTQNVEVPLSQVGDVLSNLWSVCCSSELGRKSHESTPLLPSPTPASFPLDFSQLLQATSVNPSSRSRNVKSISTPGSGVSRHNNSNLNNDESSTTNTTSAPTLTSPSSTNGRNRGLGFMGMVPGYGRNRMLMRERIEEVEDEDEEWDLVDEDVGLD